MIKFSMKAVVAMSAILLIASCANTVRGVGRDVSNTANATDQAAKDVAN